MLELLLMANIPPACIDFLGPHNPKSRDRNALKFIGFSP